MDVVMKQIVAGLWKKLLPDIVVVFTLVSAEIAITSIKFRALQPALLDWTTYNYWFEADPQIYYRIMSERYTILSATSRHPLFTLTTFPGIYILRRGLHVSPETAVGIFMAGVAGIWIAAFFILLRTLGLKRLDAVLFSVVGAASASAVFWLAVPETYSLGALTLIATISTVAYAQRVRPLPAWWYVLISAGTLGISLTNWVVALLALFLDFRWQRAVKLAIASFVIVLGAWCVEKLLFPSSQFFIRAGGYETAYLFLPLAEGPIAITSVALFHSIIMPKVHEAYGAYLSVQGARLGSGSLLGPVGVLIWLILLLLAIWWFAKEGKRSKAVWLLVLAIAWLFLLDQAFSQETFAFSLHLTPLLIAFAGFSTQGSSRPLALTLAGVLVLLLTGNNIAAFRSAADQLDHRYNTQHAFFQRVQELTDPDSLVVLGSPRQQIGPPGSWRLEFDRPNPVDMQPIELSDFNRKGWSVFYEDWSPELIEALRRKGATHFVTSYTVGLMENEYTLQSLAAHCRLVERTPNWVIYELDCTFPTPST